jgi:subtilase family serine protease
LTGLLQASGYAVEHSLGSVISQSFGVGETCVGTTLLLSPARRYLSETAWNEAQQGAGATGGAPSSIFAQPAFQQQSVQSTQRVASDLSLDADPLTGVVIVSSQIMPGTPVVMPVGGTSVGSPVAAGMVALFDQAAGRRLGFLNKALYMIGQSTLYTQAFHDIQTGNNVFVFQDNNGNVVTVPGFRASIGWDAPTVLGTPNAANLAKVLTSFL